MSTDDDQERGQLTLGIDGVQPDVDWDDVSISAGAVFLPSAPIGHRQLLAGRIKQLGALFDALNTEGQHAIVYGERGVGKTSLVSVAQRVITGSKGIAVRENCQSGDTFAKIWIRAFDSIRFGVEKKSAGFTGKASTQVITLAERLSPEPAPDDVITVLRQIDDQLVFVFDEFDQLTGGQIAKGFAETIKALSDHSVTSKVVLVGVGDNVEELLASHASIERALVQIRMPRMQPDELTDIIRNAEKTLVMKWGDAAAKRVVRLSQGLPHYVHRLGLFATREALSHKSLTVNMDDVREGMKEAVETSAQSLIDAYLDGTASQRSDALFRPVLLAAALSRSDDLGYFRPYSLKRPLKLMGHNLDVRAFASHLIKFASDERGNILQKVGTDRQWRYRFRNPLMQPFVIMRGISDGDLPLHTVDDILADQTEDEVEQE